MCVITSAHNEYFFRVTTSKYQHMMFRDTLLGGRMALCFRLSLFFIPIWQGMPKYSGNSFRSENISSMLRNVSALSCDPGPINADKKGT